MKPTKKQIVALEKLFCIAESYGSQGPFVSSKEIKGEDGELDFTIDKEFQETCRAAIDRMKK